MSIATLAHLTVRLRDCSRGAIVIEMAVSASILMILVMGLLEWTAYIRQTMQLANAARAGVEYAIGYPSDIAGIEEAVLNSGHVIADGLTITVEQFCECSDGMPIACVDSCTNGVQSNIFIRLGLTQPAHSLLNDAGLLAGYSSAASATLRVR
jgi:hypothetical protein